MGPEDLAYITPARIAQATAAARLLTSSLPKMLLTWVVVVRGLM